MEQGKECESGMFSRSFQQEDFGEDDDDEGDHFIISLEDNGEECELLDEFDGALPSSNPAQETGDVRCGSLHTPPAIPAPVGGLSQGNLPAEKSSSNPVETLNPGVVSQGSASVVVSGQSDPPLPSLFCPQWEVGGGFEHRPRGEGERSVIVSRTHQTSSNPVPVIPAASSAAGRNGKDLETIQLDGESGGIWSEAVFLSTSDGVSDRSMYTREKVNDQSREKNVIAGESTLCESQNSKLEKLLSSSGTVVSSCGVTTCVKSEHLKEKAAGKRPETTVSCSQTVNGKESDNVDLNLPSVVENNTVAGSCHGNGQCTCVMCYKGRGIVDWFPGPKTEEAEGNLVIRGKNPVLASRNVKTKSQKRRRKQNLSAVSQPNVLFHKTPGVANGQISGKTRVLLSESVQQNPYVISIPETCGPLLFNQRNAPQILMVPAHTQSLTPFSDTAVNKNARIVKSTDLPTSTHERCFLLQTVPTDLLPKPLNAEVSRKSQKGVSKSSGLHSVNSRSSSKQNDHIINNVVPAWVTKNQSSALGLSGAPLNHKPVQASQHTMSNLVSLLPGKIAQGQSTTQFIPLSPQVLSKPTSILTKAPRYINPVSLSVSSHNIPLPPPLYCASEKQASTGGQFIPVSKSMLIGKPSSSLSTSSVPLCKSAVSGTQVVILKTASTALAPLSSTLTYSSVLSENQVILAPSSGKANQHQAMYVTSTNKNSPVSLVSTSDRSVLQTPKKIDDNQSGKMIITLEPLKNPAKSPRGSETQQKPTVLGKSLLKDSPYLVQNNNSSSAVVMGGNVQHTNLVTASLGQQGPKTMPSMLSGLATASKTPEQNSLSSLLSLLNQSTQLTSTASTVQSQKTTGQSPKKMELTQTLIQLIKSHLNSPTSGKDEQALLQAVKGLVESTELQKSGSTENKPGNQVSAHSSPADLPQQNSSCNEDAEQVHSKPILSSPKPPSEGLPSSYIEDWVQQSRQYVASCEYLQKTSFPKDMCDSPDWTPKHSEKLKATGKLSSVRRTSAPAAGSSSCPVSQFNFDECPRETLILPCPKKPSSSKSKKISTLPLNGAQSLGGLASQMKENTRKTPSASVIPGDKGLKLKIKLNEKVSTPSTAETVKNNKSEHEYATSKAAGSSTQVDNVSSELKTKEVKATAEKPTRGETAEEMFQRFQEQAMQQVFNAQFGVGHVSRSLRPMRTTVSVADKFPPMLVDQQKKKKLEEEKKEEGGKKKAKEGVPIKEGPKKVAEPLIGKENIVKKKATEGSRRKKPALAPEPSLENKLNLEDCPRLQQDNSVPLRKEIYCNNILAGHKVFVKFNIFENPASERFFLVPFFNLGGSRTQFDKEDVQYISKAVAQVEEEKHMCARHLSYYKREGGKAIFFIKADTSKALTEKDYHRYSFTLKGFSPEATKRPQPVEEKWTVDNKIEIEIDRAEVEDEGVCKLQNEVVDGAVCKDNLEKNEESLRLNLPHGEENSSGLVINHVSESSQVVPGDVHSGGKDIPGCLAVSESIQVPTFLPQGKEESRSCVRMPTSTTLESLSYGKDLEKSTDEEIWVKCSEENAVSEKVSEDFAYTERLREMLLKENSSLNLEHTGIPGNDKSASMCTISAPEDAAALKYDNVLKGSSLSPCGIKFFQEIKLEKPDDGYEDSMIPFHCEADEGTHNSANNLDIQDVVHSTQALEANSIHSPKSSIMQEVPLVTIKQEPEDDGYLLAAGASVVSDSAVEPNAALSQTEPVPFQKILESEVMVPGGEVAKKAEDCGNIDNAKDCKNNDNAKDFEIVDKSKDCENNDDSKDCENNNAMDFGNNDNAKNCENNNREEGCLDLRNKIVEDVTDESKRMPTEKEDNGAASTNDVNDVDESKKIPSTSESPLSSSSVSESSELSTSSDVSSSDFEGSAFNEEEDSEEEAGELMGMSPSSLSHTGVSSTNLTEGVEKENHVQKKISSLVESLRQRLTQDKPPLPQWLVPDVKFKPEIKKKKKKKKKKRKLEDETNCTALDTTTAMEASISKAHTPTFTTAPVCGPDNGMLSATTISEADVSTHSTASVSEPIVSVCTVASISEPTVSSFSASISSPVPFTVSGNNIPEQMSSSQNYTVANASNSQLSASSISPENTIAIIPSACEVQNGNSKESPPRSAGSSNLAATVPISLVTHNSSTITLEPTVSVLSMTTANSMCTTSATATKCSVLSLSTTSSLSSSNVETMTGSLTSVSVLPAVKLHTTLPSLTKVSSTVVKSHPSSLFQSSGSMLLPVLQPEECKTATPQIPQLSGKTVQISRPESAQACSMQAPETVSLPAVEPASVEIKENLTVDFAAASSGPPQSAGEHAIHFRSTICLGSGLLKKETECDSDATPAGADIVSENCPNASEKALKTEIIDVNIKAQGVSDSTKANNPVCLRSNMSTPVSDFDVDVGLDDIPEDALSLKPIIVTPDLHIVTEVSASREFKLGFSPASSRSESPINNRIVQDRGDRVASKNGEEQQPKGFRFPFLQRKERKAQKRERKSIQKKSPEKTSIASYLCEKFAISIVPVTSNSKRPKVTSGDKPVTDEKVLLKTESNSVSSSFPSVSKTPSLDQIFGTEVDKSLLKNKLSVSNANLDKANEKLDKVEPSKKSRNGATAQVARKGITGKRRRPQMKPADSPASYTWRQLSRQSSKTPNLNREESLQCSDIAIHPCKVVLRRLEDMNLGPNGLPLEEIQIKQEIEDVVDSDTPSSSSKARRLVNKKKRKRGSGKQARRSRPREKKDIVDYYASMLESLQRKAQLLEEETRRKEIEEEERKRKELEEEEKRKKIEKLSEKEETLTDVEPAGKEKVNNLDCSENGAEVIIQQKLGDLNAEEKKAFIDTELQIEPEQNSEPLLKDDIGEQYPEASIVENDVSDTVMQREEMCEDVREENVALQKLDVTVDSIAPMSDSSLQEKNNVEKERRKMVEPVSGGSNSGKVSVSHEDTIDSERTTPGVQSGTELNDPDLSSEVAPPQKLPDAEKKRRDDTTFSSKEDENSVLGGGRCTPNGEKIGAEDKNEESLASGQTCVVSEISALKLKKDEASCEESHPVPSGFEKKDVLLAGCDLGQGGEGETKSGEISETEEDFLLGDELGGEGLVSIPEEEVEKLLGLDSHERMDMLESLEMEDDDDDDEERPLMIDEGDVTDFMDVSGVSDKESTTQKPSSETGISSDHEDSSLVEKPAEQTCGLSPPPKKPTEALLQVSPSWKRLLGAESLRQIHQETEATVRKAEISELKCDETLNKQASNNFRFKLKLPAGAVSKALRLSTEMKQVFGEEETPEDAHGVAESAGENEDGAAAMLGSGPEVESESSEKGDNQSNIDGDEGQVQPPIPKLKVKLDSAMQKVKSEFLKKGKKQGSKSRNSPKHSKDAAATMLTDEEVQFQLDMQFYLGKGVTENLCKIEPMVNGRGKASEESSKSKEDMQNVSVVAGNMEAVRQTRAQKSKDKNSTVESDSMRITRSKRNSSGSQMAEEKEESASLSLRSRKIKSSPKPQSVSPDTNVASVGQSEKVDSEDSLGIFSNATLFKTEDNSPKVRQSSEVKPLSSKGADQLLKKNAFDIHRLKMKLNPLLKGTLGKMKKELPPLNVQKSSVIQEGVNTDRISSPSKVNGSTTNSKGSESAFQKSVSDLGRVMKQIREKRSSLKSMERNNPASALPGDSQVPKPMHGKEEKVISKESADLGSEAVSESSSNQLSSTAVQSASVLKINTAKLSNLLKNFKKPVVTNPGSKEHLTLAGDAGSGSREEGKSVEEAVEEEAVASSLHRTLKRKRGNKYLSCNELAQYNSTFKVPKMSVESKSLAKSKEVESEEKGERSFFDCLPNLLMPAVWEET